MPSDLIQKRFNELARLAEKLHQLGHRAEAPDPDRRRRPDPLLALIGTFQEQLNTLGLGVRAYLEEDTRLDRGPGVQFGYDRAPYWGLVYRDRLQDGWSPPRSLLDAPRDVHLRALPLLPRLLSAVKDAAEKALHELESTTRNLRGPAGCR